MEYKLIDGEGKRQRFYEFDRELTRDVWGETVKKPYKIVMVSDATTHIERLVFPIYTKEDGKRAVDLKQVAGEWTTMIEGGDEDSIRPDKEYLEDLIKANTDKEED